MFSEQTNIGINGAVRIPGDKSISHRSIIIPSISSGICEISNILKSDDVLCTMNAFKEMGVEIKEENKKIIIKKLKQKNIGVLITDHNVRETLKIVDRVYIVNEGMIFFSGNPSEAISDDRIKKFYLGSDFSI